MDLDKLQEKINVKFKDISILKTALSHTSYAHENNEESNEKLEFLGDSILEFVSSKYLYENYKNLTEGEMTKVRAAVVCEDSLYEIAKKHNFSDFLFLGRSELIGNSNNKRTAILADSVEAVIGAIYLDLGLEKVEEFILTNLKEPIEKASKNVGMKDYKTVLQEKLQAKGEVQITYDIIKEEGPDHNKIFTAQVSLNGKVLAVGVGQTKKMAEMGAAKKALEEMN